MWAQVTARLRWLQGSGVCKAAPINKVEKKAGYDKQDKTGFYTGEQMYRTLSCTWSHTCARKQRKQLTTLSRGLLQLHFWLLSTLHRAVTIHPVCLSLRNGQSMKVIKNRQCKKRILIGSMLEREQTCRLHAKTSMSHCIHRTVPEITRIICTQKARVQFPQL